MIRHNRGQHLNGCNKIIGGTSYHKIQSVAMNMRRHVYMLIEIEAKKKVFELGCITVAAIIHVKIKITND
jgi:hypothetical protein